MPDVLAQLGSIGKPGLLEKIADETLATTAKESLQFLTKVGYPVLIMEPMI